MTTNDADDLNYATLLKQAGVRIVGTTCTCAIAVALGLFALDALAQRSLSRAAGIADANALVSRWLPAKLPPAESPKLALLSPMHAADPIAPVQPVPMTAAVPDTAAALRPAPVVAASALAAPASAPKPRPVMLAALTPAQDALGDSEDAAEAGEPKAAAVPLPMPAPERPPLPPTPAERLNLDAKGRAKAEKCLAEAVYFEARSEKLRGQIAVAQVVMNRVFSPFYPNDVCAVVYQNAHRRLSCQFTFACDGIPERITDRGPWRRAKRIAKATLDGKIWLPEVAKSTHYHAAYVRPNWIRDMRKMARHGLHTFYRPRNWGDGSEETNWSNIVHTAARAAIVE